MKTKIAFLNIKLFKNVHYKHHLKRPLFKCSFTTMSEKCSNFVVTPAYCLLAVFRVELSCTGRLDSEVTILMQLNLTTNSSKNITVLNFKRRKMCYKSKT